MAPERVSIYFCASYVWFVRDLFLFQHQPNAAYSEEMDCFDRFIEILDCDVSDDVESEGENIEMEMDSPIQSVSPISVTHIWIRPYTLLQLF